MLDPSANPAASTSNTDPVFSGGFSDQVHGAQRTFRAIMDAMARPGSTQPVAPVELQIEGVSGVAAAIALTLCDVDTPVWLDETLRQSDFGRWITFHTGANIIENADAATFGFVSDVSDMPDLSIFAQGSQSYPDRSASLIINTIGPWEASGFELAGPGIDGLRPLETGALPSSFEAAWSGNGALFPRGIDLIFAGDAQVLCLPRTARLVSSTSEKSIAGAA
jgi:alpha-D-ribose 1-methylphosphonate 5-triphosphate synthase subunit PhnH